MTHSFPGRTLTRVSEAVLGHGGEFAARQERKGKLPVVSEPVLLAHSTLFHWVHCLFASQKTKLATRYHTHFETLLYDSTMTRQADNRKRALKPVVTVTMSPGWMLLVAFLLSSPMQSSAFSFATMSSSTSSRTNNSRLDFRNGDEVDSKYQRKLGSSNTDELPSANKWWDGLRQKSPVQPSSEEDEASQRVEEYLKFLDKRYSQIHEKDAAPTRKVDEPSGQQPSFSVIRWLQKEPAQSSDEDALFALGVAAKSADAALGNRQQPQLGQSPTSKSSMKMADGERVVTNSALKSAIEGLKQSPVFQRILRSRRALLRYESAKAQQFLKASANAIKKIPAVASKLLMAGGGHKTMAITFGILSVLLVHVLLPAVGSIMKESLATQS